MLGLRVVQGRLLLLLRLRGSLRLVERGRLRAQQRGRGARRVVGVRHEVSFAKKTEALAMSHDTFSRNTRNQLKQVFDALRELTVPPDPPRRPIGFITPEEGSEKTPAAPDQK